MQSVPMTTDVVSSNLDQGEVYNWHYVSDLRQICGFLPGSPVSSINNVRILSDILLKVALNTIIYQTINYLESETWLKSTSHLHKILSP